MHWKFNFKEKPLRLCIKITGNIVKEEASKMVVAGLALARAKNCKRFIVNYCDAVLKDSRFDSYEFNSNLDKLGMKRTDRIAIVINQDIEAHRFAEMVANNRGWNLIKYFSNKNSAETWIRE